MHPGDVRELSRLEVCEHPDLCMRAQVNMGKLSQLRDCKQTVRAELDAAAQGASRLCNLCSERQAAHLVRPGLCCESAPVQRAQDGWHPGCAFGVAQPVVLSRSRHSINQPRTPV